MRRFASALAVASLLGCSLALAQAPANPGSEGSQAPPPSSSPSESTGEHATSGKHKSYKTCSKEAHAKALKGTERKQFIKDCEHGKSTED